MLEHVDISHLSGFHTPATARYFVEYNGSNLDELREAAQFAYAHDLSILTVAGGKNLLLAFDEYPGLVIHNNSRGYTIIQNAKCKEQNEQEIGIRQNAKCKEQNGETKTKEQAKEGFFSQIKEKKEEIKEKESIC